MVRRKGAGVVLLLSDVVAGSKNFFTATDVQSMKLYLFRPQEIVNMEQIERIFDGLEIERLRWRPLLVGSNGTGPIMSNLQYEKIDSYVCDQLYISNDEVNGWC